MKPVVLNSPRVELRSSERFVVLPKCSVPRSPRPSSSRGLSPPPQPASPHGCNQHRSVLRQIPQWRTSPPANIARSPWPIPQPASPHRNGIACPSPPPPPASPHLRRLIASKTPTSPSLLSQRRRARANIAWSFAIPQPASPPCKAIAWSFATSSAWRRQRVMESR